MHICQVHASRIPVRKYGGTQRDIWWLGKELNRLSHQVTFLVGKGSTCPFARVIPYDSRIPIEAQIPHDVDIVHFHMRFVKPIAKPFLVTVHGNAKPGVTFHRNTVFLSRDHAKRHHAEVYVYNGLDPEDYGVPDLAVSRDYFHFLGRASWRVKNVRGAIELSRRAGSRLEVLGGHRVNFNMGFRVTLDRHVHFHGMLGGERKHRMINGSKGLVFPVIWDEPFGVAIIESLYFGCPVFGTPNGSLPELIRQDVGFLSNSMGELSEAMKNADAYDRRICHAYAMEHFNSRKMTARYLHLYQKILGGDDLHASDPHSDARVSPRTMPMGA